ncbi:MAG: L,D-transpeptidase [Chloroflexota bacterium]|nr:L,D-transpeptidase [Chloroflexota bacterium]
MVVGHGPASHARAGFFGLLATVALLLALLAPLASPRVVTAQDDGDPAIVPTGDNASSGGQTARTSSEDWAPPTRVYVPETGQSIDGLFLDLWRNGGGVWAFGNPITPEITLPNGHIVQYYGYARFEYWPEGDADGNVVRLGDIGKELRPVTVRRTMLGFKGANARDPQAALEAMAMVRAWLPLNETQVPEDSDEWRFVPETGHSVATGFKDFWERTGEAGYLGNPLTEEYTVAGVTYQVFERGQLAWEPGTDPYMMPVGKLLAERYGLDQSAVEQGDVPAYSEDLFIPPPPPTPTPEADQDEDAAEREPDPNGERWIEVDLTNQYMRAWQGDVVVKELYVSTGRPGFDTPTGTFFINSKVPIQDMEGVIGGEYYNVPEVPDVMYFTDVGHAFHGTYWHTNFGQVMSHGCVNLPIDVAEWLYEWTPMGARVEIHN